MSTVTSNVLSIPKNVKEFTKITINSCESKGTFSESNLGIFIKWGFTISPVSHQHEGSHGIIQVDHHMNVVFLTCRLFKNLHLIQLKQNHKKRISKRSKVGTKMGFLHCNTANKPLARYKLATQSPWSWSLYRFHSVFLATSL